MFNPSQLTPNSLRAVLTAMGLAPEVVEATVQAQVSDRSTPLLHALFLMNDVIFVQIVNQAAGGHAGTAATNSNSTLLASNGVAPPPYQAPPSQPPAPSAASPDNITASATTGGGSAYFPTAAQAVGMATSTIAGVNAPYGASAASAPGATPAQTPSGLAPPWSTQPTGWPTMNSTVIAPTQMPPALASHLFGASSGGTVSATASSIPNLRSSLASASTAHAHAPRGMFQSRSSRGRRIVNTTAITTKKWIVIPHPGIEVISKAVKFACSEVGLNRCMTIRRNFTPEQVHQAIRTTFPPINWDLHGYGYVFPFSARYSHRRHKPRTDAHFSFRWYEHVRILGPERLQRTGLDQFPNGEDLATAYHRKKVGIIKLTSPAEVEGFWEAYSLADGGNHDDNDDNDSDHDNGDDDDDNNSSNTGASGQWQCPKCRQRFLQPALDAHLDSCEVRPVVI